MTAFDITTVGSVFANITAVAGTNAAIVTTAAASVAAAAAVGGSEIVYELSMIRNLRPLILLMCLILMLILGTRSYIEYFNLT